jgi:hypothetical protein
MLKQGYIEKFLAGQGRADLAMAAKQAAKFPDKDRGLDEFLDKLPTQAVQKPQLTVEPTDINLGTLKIGADRKIDLKLRNDGQRLLYGSVVAENCNWISIGSASGGQKKLFQFGSELTIPLHISGKRLRAGSKPLEGKLIISSNAGDEPIVIAIKADVPVKPYPDGVLAGAKSPRQVAEKAKANPKDSAALFEKGAVAQWYKDNGWIYPVRGPAASGMGAVQQFFEALGLTAPPKVSINQSSVTLQANPGERLEHLLEVRTEEKRPVFAHGVADQPWVEVGRAKLNGRTAQVPLVISSVPNRPGETITAKVAVTSNGGKKFMVPVTLKIGNSLDFFAAPVGGAPVAAGAGAFALAGPMVAPSRRGSSGSSNPMHLLPLLLLFLVLGGIVIWDLLGKGPGVIEPEKRVDSTEPSNAGPFAYDEKRLKDSIPRVALNFYQQSKDKDRFGILLPQLADPNAAIGGAKKRLFFDPFGMGNNTILDVNGYKFIYGNRQYGKAAVFGKDPVTKAELRDFPVANKKGRAWVTDITYSAEGATIQATQYVEIYPGDTTNLLDTVFVKYILENKGSVPATVQMRTLLDTYIGSNDGVPFFVPPVEGVPGHMVDGKEVMTGKQIPDFVQVLETGDLNDKNSTNALLGLHLNGIEQPVKFVICRWPGNETGGGSEISWGSENGGPGDWAYKAMNDPADKPKDSCCVIYWGSENIPAGKKRVLGYTLGLGRMAGEGETENAGADKNHQLGLSFIKATTGAPFPVTAYVKGDKEQKVTLKIPDGVELAPGETPEKTVDGTADRAAITWKVKAAKKGVYKFEANAPGIGTAKGSVEVRPDSESIFR